MKKKKVFVLVLTGIVAFAMKVGAQSQGPNSPMSATEQSYRCLSCPGADWTNFNNVKAGDSVYAAAQLDAYPNCFQSTCYYSRGLIARNFGFSIPSTAVITGIQADVERKAAAPSTLTDSVIYLMKNNFYTGASRSSLVTWPVWNTSISYGNATDLWGTTWLPADVNDTGFGLLVKPYNMNPNIVTAYVDHVQITVYYSEVNGVASPAASGFDNMNVVTEAGSGNILISFNTSKLILSYSIEVFNSIGQSVFKKENREWHQSGQCHETVSSSGFADGVYIVMVSSPEGNCSKRIVIGNEGNR